MKFRILIPLLLAGAAVGASAQVAEIFSKHVQVFTPHGEFPQTLIKNAPASGNGWRLVDDQNSGYKLMVPEDAQIDTTPKENCVLQVVLPGGPQKPRPLFRVDSYKPGEDDATEVDAEYAAEYADGYPELAFNGKFSVVDSGMITLSKKTLKTNLAMVGGSYLQGAVPSYRVQCAYLSKDRQLFFTFDCPERDWPKHAPVVARILLSLEIGGAKKS